MRQSVARMQSNNYSRLSLSLPVVLWPVMVTVFVFPNCGYQKNLKTFKNYNYKKNKEFRTLVTLRQWKMFVAFQYWLHCYSFIIYVFFFFFWVEKKSHLLSGSYYVFVYYFSRKRKNPFTRYWKIFFLLACVGLPFSHRMCSEIVGRSIWKKCSFSL